MKGTRKLDKSEEQKFIEQCIKKLNFDNLEDITPYKSLPIAILDCVYSLRADYKRDDFPMLERYAKKYLNDDIYASGDLCSDFINHIDLEKGNENFANNILKNNHYWYHRPRIDICRELAEKFIAQNIETVDDFNSEEMRSMKKLIKSVYGIGDAGVNYLFMITGNSNLIKPDVHIHDFITKALNHDLSNSCCLNLIAFTADYLSIEKNIKLSPRMLDHMIWLTYQK